MSAPEARRQQEEPGVTLAGGHQRVAGIQFHAPASRRRAVRGHSLPDSPGRSLMGRHLSPPPWCFRRCHWPHSQAGAQPANRSHQGLQSRGGGRWGAPCAVAACAIGLVCELTLSRP